MMLHWLVFVNGEGTDARKTGDIIWLQRMYFTANDMPRVEIYDIFDDFVIDDLVIDDLVIPFPNLGDRITDNYFYNGIEYEDEVDDESEEEDEDVGSTAGADSGGMDADDGISEAGEHEEEEGTVVDDGITEAGERNACKEWTTTKSPLPKGNEL